MKYTVVQMGFYTHNIGGIFYLKYLGQKCKKLDNQGQFRAPKILNFSKLSLVVQFDTFLAEIFEVKDASYIMCVKTRLDYCIIIIINLLPASMSC